MNERLVDTIVVLEEAAYIRHERLNGDPDRGPDETTVEDVIEALLRRKTPPQEIIEKKGLYTRALRIMLRGLIDQQR
jgi:hypothetical protein